MTVSQETMQAIEEDKASTYKASYDVYKGTPEEFDHAIEALPLKDGITWLSATLDALEVIRKARAYKFDLLIEQVKAIKPRIENDKGIEGAVKLMYPDYKTEGELVADNMLAHRTITEKYGERILRLAYLRLSDKVLTLDHAYRSVLYAVKQYRKTVACSFEQALDYLEEPEQKAVSTKLLTRMAQEKNARPMRGQCNERNQEDEFEAMENAYNVIAFIRDSMSNTIKARINEILHVQSINGNEAFVHYINRADNERFIYRVYQSASMMDATGTIKTMNECGVSKDDFIYLLVKYF